AILARHRRRGIARALPGRACAVLATRGDMSVTGEVDDTSVASVSLLTGLGARRYGGNVGLIRRQPGRAAPDPPDRPRPSTGPQATARAARSGAAEPSRRGGNAVSPRTRTGNLRDTLLPPDRRGGTPRPAGWSVFKIGGTRSAAVRRCRCDAIRSVRVRRWGR